MDTYENLLDVAEKSGLNVVEYAFSSNRIKGLYCDNTAAISTQIQTSTEKGCVLAEELGHYYTTVGNILDQNRLENRKQELHARLWAYNKLIGLMGIIRAYKQGYKNLHEMADYLEVTEEFLADALKQYKQTYGECVTVDNYVVFFEPTLGVLELKR